MNVTLIGYGNAQTSYNGKRVTCQHGTGECNALMVEDCAIKHNPEFSDHWPFVLCMENAGDGMLSDVQRCATQAKLNYQTIATCYKGSEGTQALIAAGKATGQHNYVPWVEINGRHSAQADSQSFLKAVCAAMEGKKPAGCTGAAAAEGNETAPAPPCPMANRASLRHASAAQGGALA